MVEHYKCTAGKTAQQVKVVMCKLGERSLIPGTPITKMPSGFHRCVMAYKPTITHHRNT